MAALSIMNDYVVVSLQLLGSHECRATRLPVHSRHSSQQSSRASTVLTVALVSSLLHELRACDLRLRSHTELGGHALTQRKQSDEAPDLLDRVSGRGCDWHASHLGTCGRVRKGGTSSKVRMCLPFSDARGPKTLLTLLFFFCTSRTLRSKS